MSPYLIFGLAMLGIVIFSLIVTGNLAATFNERAKRDLRVALEPLANQLGGAVNLDDARIDGRSQGQITSAQVISGPGGMGRLFETIYIEPAGGSEWKAVVRRPKADTGEWDRTFDGPSDVSSAMQAPIFELLDSLLPFPGWFELTYKPDAGAITLTRAMQSRRDVPVPERFALYLDVLSQVATLNRSAQRDGARAGTRS